MLKSGDAHGSVPCPQPETAETHEHTSMNTRLAPARGLASGLVPARLEASTARLEAFAMEVTK